MSLVIEQSAVLQADSQANEKLHRHSINNAKLAASNSDAMLLHIEIMVKFAHSIFCYRNRSTAKEGCGNVVLLSEIRLFINT